MSRCEFCNAVAIAIERAVDDHEEFVWEYEKVEQNHECATCQKVVQTFHREYFDFLLPKTLGYVSFDKDHWRLRLRDPDIPHHFLRTPFINIGLVANSASPNELGFSILRRRINVMGIKRWIDRCDQNHIGKCHSLPDSTYKIPDATGLIFIDVEKSCLVQQPKDGSECRYAALSYVWGPTIDPFQTTVSNFDSLSKPNAFKLPENIWRLPNTIKDSILLCRTLSVQYLWVDRFCIVQDDKVSKPRQLAAMTSIYLNSYFTIAATEGEDSSYGLCGIGKRRPRIPPFEAFDFTPSCRMVASLPRIARSRQVYHTRGWTFQEWTFSRRMIVFHDQTVTWKCQDHHQQENGRPSRNPFQNLASLTQWASPSAYCSRIDEYSRRHLSNPGDILTAFDAFLTVQSRVTKSEILHGLPEPFFNNMLCWHHDIDTPQRRRVDSEGNVLKQFPSWSWAGWFGPIDMLLPDEASHLRMRCAPGYLVYPCIIDVYKLPVNLNPGEREMIKDLHYYEARGVTPLVKDEGMSEGRYVHYKLALPGDQANLPSISDTLYSTVIEFRTRRMIATLAKFDYNGTKKELASILDHKGQMIGTLDFRLSLHPLDLPKHNVQLICISCSEPVCANHARSRTPGGQYLVAKGCKEDCFVHEQDYYSGIYEPASYWQFRCYDVLWIEWEGDIAYRKAIGQVWKEEWDAADTEEIDIRLG